MLVVVARLLEVLEQRLFARIRVVCIFGSEVVSRKRRGQNGRRGEVVESSGRTVGNEIDALVFECGGGGGGVFTCVGRRRVNDAIAIDQIGDVVGHVESRPRLVTIVKLDLV